MFEGIKRKWRQTRGEESVRRHLSDAQVEALETMFCLVPETIAALERAASDREAYDEIEGVFRMTLENESSVASALEAAESMKYIMAQEPTDAYYLARRVVESSRYFGAKGPRHCLERMLGRKIDDREWAGSHLRGLRDQFERAWADPSDFKSPTLDWVKAQSGRQYWIYLRGQYRGG
jgi:hypothetical protein